MQAYVARASEIDVNTTTSGNQYQSTIAQLPGGGFVIAWVDMSELNDDGDGRAIMAQVFDAKGKKLGGEIPVNTTTAGDQAEPAITVLKSGNFVIAWTDGSAQVANGYEIRAQMFDKTGDPIRDEFQVNTTTPFIQSGATLTAMDNGGFIAVWQSDERIRTGFEYGIHAQLYDAKGKEVGAEFRVDRGGSTSFEDASATTLKDGSVVITWTHMIGNSGRGVIEGQRISASGKLLGDNFAIDDFRHPTSLHPSITPLANGGFIATWDAIEPRGISARLFSASGKPVGASFLVNDGYADCDSPSAVQLEGGNIVVAYQTDSGVVVAQLLDKNGAKLGSELPLNLESTGPGLVDVIANKGGGFTVTWTDVGAQDGSGAGVHARIVDLDSSVHVLKGSAEAETLTAPSTAQWNLQGLAGDDTLIGERYNDILDGGKGADRMEGRAGDDRYIVDNGGDMAVEIDGMGYDTVLSTLSTYTLPSFVEALELSGSKAVSGIGNDGANLITGTSGNNQLDGGRGDDHLIGGDGKDTLLGNVGNDLVEGGAGKDALNGGTGDDVLKGGSSDDKLVGEIGNDRLDGGSGNDSMAGGAGDDVYVIDAKQDVVTEKADQGHDRVESAISWTLGKNLEDLTLTGGKDLKGTGNSLDNGIVGGKGDDTLSGLGGADVLDGGAGQDVLAGGSGKDRFVFDDGDAGTTAKTADRITDFATGDRIDLSGIDAVKGGKDSAFTFIGTDAFSGHAGELHYKVDGKDVLVSGDTNGDKVADFFIDLGHVTALAQTDFVL